MSKQEVIKDTIALKDFLSSVINETLSSKKKLIVEQDEDEKETLKSGDINADEVIEKLNTIRAGKSFKDQNIKTAMESYVSDLDDAEKTALFAFLKGIAQIVGGEVEGKEALEPSDKPANVKMEKKPSSQKVTIKPNVIKKPSAGEKPKEKASKSPEDTTPPAPIVAKKKQLSFHEAIWYNLGMQEVKFIKLPSGETLEVTIYPGFIEKVRAHFGLGLSLPVDDDHIRMYIYGAFKGAIDRQENETI